MKKIAIIIAATMSINANAQSVTSKASADSVLNSLNDKNYVEYRQSKDLYVDNIPYFVGNSTDAQHLYYARNCGAYISAGGTVTNFDGNTEIGVEVAAGWMGRQWYGEFAGNWKNHHYNKVDTDRKNKPFTGFTFSGRIGKKIVDWNNHHDQLWCFAGYGLDLNYDHHSEVSIDGNTSSYSDITFKGFTSACEGGFRYEHKFWGSPIHLFGEASVSARQKYTSDGTIWRGAVEARVGISYTLFRGSGWDEAALSKMNLTKKQARKLARTKSTIESY